MTRMLAVVLVAVLQAASAGPQFEVASIKSCGAADPGFRGGGPTQYAPNRIAINCQILKGLIQQAYVAHKTERTDQAAVLRTPIEGGPDWISAERFSITAKSPVEATQDVMMGPMMRTLLENRFKLQIRRLSREIPTWDLVVAKGGHKLTPFQEGSCVRVTPALPPAPPPALPPGQHRCLNRTQFKGTSMTLDAEGITLDELTNIHLYLAAGRPVADKTGLTGRFNFHLEYAPPEGTRVNGAEVVESTAPSIFTALQEQLGLKLETAKGQGEYLVVDRVEKPTEN